MSELKIKLTKVVAGPTFCGNVGQVHLVDEKSAYALIEAGAAELVCDPKTMVEEEKVEEVPAKKKRAKKKAVKR